MGHRYEKALAKAMPWAHHGQWLTFADAAGPGYCQPDLICRLSDCNVVLEAKLRDVEAARRQLRDLYEPCLRHILPGEVLGIAVVRNLSGLQGCAVRVLLCESLKEAVLRGLERRDCLAVWHWRERSPVGYAPLVPQAPIPRGAPRSGA